MSDFSSGRRGDRGHRLSMRRETEKHPMEKAQDLDQDLGFFVVLVAWDGIEPPTQGFSILCSTD
jgi:hypothetical protein